MPVSHRNCWLSNSCSKKLNFLFKNSLLTKHSTGKPTMILKLYSNNMKVLQQRFEYQKKRRTNWTWNGNNLTASMSGLSLPSTRTFLSSLSEILIMFLRSKVESTLMRQPCFTAVSISQFCFPLPLRMIFWGWMPCWIASITSKPLTATAQHPAWPAKWTISGL